MRTARARGFLRWTVLVLGVVVLATACTSSRDAAESPRPKRAPALTGDALQAQRLAEGLGHRVVGEVTSAAYVVGSYAQWKGNPGMHGLPSASLIKPHDKVFVVRLVGDFVSIHSRKYTATLPERDSYGLLVYNATRDVVPMTEFGGSGGPPAPPAAVDPQLTALGSPHPIAYAKHA